MYFDFYINFIIITLTENLINCEYFSAFSTLITYFLLDFIQTSYIYFKLNFGLY